MFKLSEYSFLAAIITVVLAIACYAAAMVSVRVARRRSAYAGPAAVSEGGVVVITGGEGGASIAGYGTLFTYLAALRSVGSRSPCGFLHLPYLPEQVAWLIRRHGGAPDSAASANLDLPSMALETQVTAVKAAIGALARQASALPPL